MKVQYKNKRDFYKAEAERNANTARMWKESAEEKQREIERIKAEKKKGLSCVTYCSQCQVVYRALVPNGQTVHESGCAYCGVKNAGYLVSEVKSY